MKVKVTKASTKDSNKITIRSSQLGYAGVFQPGTKIVVSFNGTNGKTHDVVLKASRAGTTFYGDCPRALKMPSVGKPKYYTLSNKSMVVKYV